MKLPRPQFLKLLEQDASIARAMLAEPRAAQARAVDDGLARVRSPPLCGRERAPLRRALGEARGDLCECCNLEEP